MASTPPERTTPETDRDALVVEHLELVGRVVAEVSARYPRHVDRSELWNAGALGLVEASRRFDPEAGIPFARYAAIRIRGAVIDSTRSRDWASRTVRRRAREVREAQDALEERLGREPSEQEIATHLEIEVEEVQMRIASAELGSLLRLDQPISGDEDVPTLADRIEERRVELSPEASLEQMELRGALAEAVAHLPRIQSEVVIRSFVRGELLADIAAGLGLTEARLSQIRSEAIDSLRAFFATQYEGVEEPRPDGPGKRARMAFLEEMAGTSWLARVEAADALEGLGS